MPTLSVIAVLFCLKAGAHVSSISAVLTSESKPFSLHAGIHGVQYFSESTSDSKFQQQAQIEGQFEDSKNFLVKAHGFAGTFSTPKSSYYGVPELYIGRALGAPENTIILGRKIENFSFLDRQQNLGLFNPYFSNDMIHYKEQGLIGLHANSRVSVFGIYGGFFPYYIPNQGPQVYEEDGEIRSSNRWAQRPPTQFRFGTQNREIIYAIRDYEIDEIVKNAGSAISIFIGKAATRPWVKASYTRKPVNQIPLSRETFGTASNFVGQVKLSPVVTYNQVQSVDFNMDSGRFKTTWSYLEDRVENQTALEDETLQFLAPLKMYGLWIATDLSDFFDRRFVTEISYAQLHDGEIKDLLADGRPSLFTFSSQRSLFKNPFRIKFESELFFVNDRPLSSAFAWTFDQLYQGTLFSGSLRYEAVAQMNINFGFDLLGVEEEQAETHFLQEQQANDRVYGGLEYVF